MRRLSFAGLALVLAFGFQATADSPSASGLSAASNPEGERSEKGVVKASALRLRSGPSTRRRTLRILKRGTSMKVIGRQGNWLRVEVAGRTGYVYKKHVKVSTAPKPETSVEIVKITTPGIVGMLRGESGGGSSEEARHGTPSSGTESSGVLRSSNASRSESASHSSSARTINLPLGASEPVPGARTGGSVPGIRKIAASRSNYTRRSSRRITKIVLHTIEGSEDAGISWFRNPRAKVSAHYVVSYTGRVTQLMRDSDIAWHARGVNSSTIGIENEGYSGRNNWTAAQISKLASLVRFLCERHGIAKTRANIIGHYQVDPARRNDPGRYFPWDRFIAMVNGR